MGSATSSIPTEPIVAAAALAGALGYGYVHYFRPTAHSGDEDAYSDANAGASNAPSTFRGQKKRGRKLQLPGDATLKNLDVLDAPVVPGSLPVSTSASSKARERPGQIPPQPRQEQRGREAPVAAHAHSRDVIPGGFDGTAVMSADDARDTPQEQQPLPSLEQVQAQQQQHVSVGTTKKLKKKKGKKAATATSDLSSASALGGSQSISTSTEGVAGKTKKAPASVSVAVDSEDTHDERWTRVEARKKKAPLQPQGETTEATAADVTTSDAGITTSVTGNSSPVTERTTEDELRSDLDEYVSFFFFCFSIPPAVLYLMCTLFLVGVRWRHLRHHFGMQYSPLCLYAPHQARSLQKDLRGMTMKVCMLMKTHRARKMVVGASSEAGAAVSPSFSLSVLSESIRLKYFLFFFTEPNKAVSEGAGGAMGTATTTMASQSQPQTKKQRQNAQRREALKEAKREREALQQAALATHKRELNHARTVEQIAPASKRTGSRFDSLG